MTPREAPFYMATSTEGLGMPMNRKGGSVLVLGRTIMNRNVFGRSKSNKSKLVRKRLRAEGIGRILTTIQFRMNCFLLIMKRED
jgi:hypothetical protein